MSKITEVLSKSELFRELDKEQLDVIEKICTPMSFQPGEVIGKQGAKNEYVFIIEEGLIAVVVEIGPLSQRQVQAASNFDVIGWSAMIMPNVYIATGKAVEQTKALAFHGQELCNLCDTNPVIGCKVCRGVARVVAHWLKDSYAQLLGVTYQV